MSNKSFGLGVERKAKEILKQEGWTPARCRGSFGVFDIIAMHPEKGYRLIQIKSTKQQYYSYSKEIEEIRKLKIPENTKKELWIWLSPNQKRKKRGWQIIEIV